MLGSNYNRYELVIEYNDVNNNKVINSSDILGWLNQNRAFIKFYALILHDKDQEIKNHEIVNKHLHYHLVIELHNQRKDSIVLNDIVLYLRCNKDIVGIMPAYEWVKRVRYLTHIDDKEKYQYDKKSVLTDNTLQYDEYFDGIDTENINMLTLHNLCIDCENINDVYFRVGLKNARLYRSIINDLWEELRVQRYNRSLSKEKELPF